MTLAANEQSVSGPTGSGHPRASDGPARRRMVEFQAVGKRYGAVDAVQAVSFAIETGTLVTLLGPSGCGKTTTLRLIAGLELPTSGRILIDGEDVSRLSAAERDVSMVFQSYALFPHMTVLENVCYGLRAGGIGRREAEVRASEKLAVVGLAGFEARLPSELSGGQQQRVAVARAIVLEPKVLLFDEPLSNLDARLRRQVREDIRALQQDLGLTVAYVTHDQEEALAVSDRIIVMQGGGIVQEGSPRDLYERPASRFVAGFIGNANLLPATATPGGPGFADVACGAAGLRLPWSGPLPGAVRLAVRPHAVRLASPDAGAPGIPGIVRKAAYLGTHMEYDVALEGFPGDVFVVDPHVHAPRAPGTPVLAVIDPNGAALVPDG